MEKKEVGENSFDEQKSSFLFLDTFMRQLLVKTARRQFKKSRLNDAIETFYQLVVATNGQLCAEEAWLLFDICSQKIAGTYDFYHRIGNLMREVSRKQ